MLNCPCCDFMAAFKSVLEDHYIAHHKMANKNACLVCHLKFENTRGFIDHFGDHANGKLPTKLPVEINSQVGSPAAVASNRSSADVQVVADKVASKLTVDGTENVVKNLADVSVLDPSKDPDVKIPYQAAIHDKNLKDSKLKTIEELKSPNDLVAMKCEEKLKHYFKCVLYNCTFTSHDRNEYFMHLDLIHKGKRLHCCYCLKEFFSGESVTDHMVGEHSKRNYQCSSCFYRAYSKVHVQIHIKNYHTKDTNTEIYTCEPVVSGAASPIKETDDALNTTWPYICAVGECSFQSFDPKDFKVHNETVHRTVTVFYCYYCKVDFISLKRLLNHYRLHGINTFQCNYCIHGSETKDEILLHLCSIHADMPLKAYMRGTEEDASIEVQQVPSSAKQDSSGKTNNIEVTESVEKNADSSDKLVEKACKTSQFETSLYEVADNTFYPKYLKSICSDLICGIPYCSEKLENMSAYIGHLRNIHAAANFTCPHCPEVFEMWEAFKTHLSCHGANLYACGFASCTFFDWDKCRVVEHLKTHETSDAEVVIIREKDQESKENNEVKALPNNCPFAIEEENFQCFFCLYKSSSACIMKNHLYKEMFYKRVKCDHCRKRFGSKNNLKVHTLKQHPESQLNCTIIPNLQVEKLVKMVLKERTLSFKKESYTCKNCSENFNYSNHWQRHIPLCFFKNYQPYECGYCLFSCADVKMLRFHIDEKHFPKTFLSLQIASSTIEEEISKKIQSARLEYLQDMVGKAAEDENEAIKDSWFAKFYVCSICSFESNHKYNIEKHFERAHVGAKVDMLKSMRKVDISTAPTGLEDVSNDDSKTLPDSSSDIKRYRCGFCIKKMFTLQELRMHVESGHSVRDEMEYFYYYNPDPKSVLNESEDAQFECSYCKSGKDNLAAVKKHCDLMHPDSPFKVRGFVSRNSGTSLSAIIACGYCYQRLHNSTELKRHLTTNHPGQPHKSIGDFPDVPRKKRPLESGADDLPYKKVRFGNQVYVCAHCGAAYSSKEHITTHSKRSHSRLQLEFSIVTPSSSGDYESRFYKCEFCLFTAEKDSLLKHISTKHKMRVTCGHCNKRFEFASKLREHHEACHKGLPVKYKQETVGNSTKSEIKTDNDPSDKNENKSLDPSNIFVTYYSLDGKVLKMSVLSYSKLHNIYPKVVLREMKKDNIS